MNFLLRISVYFIILFTLSSNVLIHPTYLNASSSNSLSNYPILEPSININDRAGSRPVDKGIRPIYKNDIAWGKPAFASTYWEDGFPAKATDDSLSTAYRTASSTGTWFYVDLGTAQDVQSIVTTLFVDSDFGPRPHTYFIAANDLNTWHVIFDEKNDENLVNRGKPRTLVLPNQIQARYVGIYAAYWNGGWADLTLFAVIPPDLTPTVPKAGTTTPTLILIMGSLFLLGNGWRLMRKTFLIS